MKNREVIFRIIFGVIFLIAAVVTILAAPAEYIFLAVVLIINALFCCGTGIPKLILTRRAEKNSAAEDKTADEAQKILSK